jgi:endonuclease YncB( thermonuclease family)
VREGFAFAYTQYSKKFVEDEKFAIKNKIGMWSMDFIFPWDFRKSKYNFK